MKSATKQLQQSHNGEWNQAASHYSKYTTKNNQPTEVKQNTLDFMVFYKNSISITGHITSLICPHCGTVEENAEH